MKNYKLLTPGPLTTTKTVKEEMLFDRCTWDDEYKNITQSIRSHLLDIAQVSSEEYTSVLIQGSGSFAVEAVLGTTIKNEDKLLVIGNGAYAERMISMAKCMGINCVVIRSEYNNYPNMNEIKGMLEEDKSITHIAMVHCETTTGILNPLEELAVLSKEYGKILIIDAMSSFGGIPINIKKLEIDYLVSSANKCIQGVPGFGFIIAKKSELLKCKGVSKSLSLDLYDQWEAMDKDGKWRYTSPTHVVAAFLKAIEELLEEGGVEARYKRYSENNNLLRQRLGELGIQAYISKEKQSPIITTFEFPNKEFDFTTFYNFIKDRGFVIYPGKLTSIDTFRVGNIGEIYLEDIKELCKIIEEYIEGGK